MGGSPITIVTSGGVPITNTAYRGPAFTPVASGGIPATLVASGGMPVTLVNADNSLWTGVEMVGGTAIGSSRQAGSVAEGYTYVDGDDYSGSSADFITPTSHLASIATTRHYGKQSSAPALMRGAGSLAGYDADPWHTGHEDINRGVPLASFADLVKVEGSFLKLKARRALTAEKAVFGPSLASKGSVSSMVHLARRIQIKPPFYFETAIRVPLALASWGVYHPCIWFLDSLPSNGADGHEIDIEGYGPDFSLYHAIWTNWVSNFDPLSGKLDAISQTITSLIGVHVTTTGYQVYQDGVAKGSPVVSDFSLRPLHPVFSCHILQSGYVQADWDNAGAAGAEFHIDYWRLAVPGAVQRKPLTAGSILKADFNTAFSLALPDAATIFGPGVSSYVLDGFANEENAPGKGSAGAEWWRTALPASVARSGNLLTGTVADRPGRLMMAAVALDAAGQACRPYPITLCVGPRVTMSALSFSSGDVVSLDAYAAVDCGDLFAGKAVTVTGLPSFLSFNASSGLITGTAPAGASSASFQISGTNAVGQTASKTIAYSVAAASSDYTAWTGPGWFDASDDATITHSSNLVSAMANKRGGDGFIQRGAAITRVPSTLNGKTVLRLTRDTANPAALMAANKGASPISAVFQGNDVPHTYIMVYTPTDANTGFPFMASTSGNSTDSQAVGIVRRAAAASSIRRQLLESTSGDVNFGAGQLANTPRVVAVKHTGTTVTVWDNSLTKSVNAAAQDTGAMPSDMIAMVGARTQPNGGNGVTLAATACAMDFAELVIEGTARSDSDIQAAMSTMATKWGITLS